MHRIHILVGGKSRSGKSTLCEKIGDLVGSAYEASMSYPIKMCYNEAFAWIDKRSKRSTQQFIGGILREIYGPKALGIITANMAMKACCSCAGDHIIIDSVRTKEDLEGYVETVRNHKSNSINTNVRDAFFTVLVDSEMAGEGLTETEKGHQTENRYGEIRWDYVAHFHKYGKGDAFSRVVEKRALTILRHIESRLT